MKTNIEGYSERLEPGQGIQVKEKGNIFLTVSIKMHLLRVFRFFCLPLMVFPQTSCEQVESKKVLDEIFTTSNLSQARQSADLDKSYRSAYQEIIVVDGPSDLSDDNNDGSSAKPLRSISAGIKRAVQFKKAGISSRIIVKNGVYRESVRFDTYTNYYKNQPDNSVRILLEGEEAGKVVVSGSDPESGLELEREGNFVVIPWDQKWGVQENPTRGTREVKDIVRRREMVFQDGRLLKQVLSLAELEVGAFLVEEIRDRILVYPLEDVKEEFELSVRENLLNLNHEHNVEIRNFVFERAASLWRDETAAVILANGKNVSLIDCDIIWNNGRGILAVNSEDILLSDVKMNYNGWDGWGTWRVKNFHAKGTETSYNNWRGHLGGFYVWSVGNKLLAIHGLRLENHRAENNYSRGLWLDFDNTDVSIDSLYLLNNLNDGVFIEANPGPIVITNSIISGNGDFGILSANSENVTVSNTTIKENNLGAMNLTGNDDGREVQDWDTKKVHKLELKNWEWDGNTIGHGSQSEYLVTTTLGRSAWAHFESSLKSDNNIWKSKVAIIEAPFIQISKWKLNSGLDLEEWQKRTGLDSNSTSN